MSGQSMSFKKKNVKPFLYYSTILLNPRSDMVEIYNLNLIGNDEVDQAFERITIGLQTKPLQDNSKKRLIAYHEIGKALVAYLTPLSDTVDKISILRRSGNLSGSGSISGFDANLNDQTGTTYTLASTDNGKVVTLNNGSAITVTIPTGLGDGFNCLLVQKGAGQVTVTKAGGGALNNRSTQTKTAGQHAIVTLVHIGSEVYILSGDTGA